MTTCHPDEKPSDQEPLAIECTHCSGGGCANCHHGHVLYASCPQRGLSSEMVSLVHDAEMLEKGALLEDGGLNNQDAWYINTSRLFLDFKNHLENSDNE